MPGPNSTKLPPVKLDWQVSGLVRASAKPAEILITGTNLTDEPIQLFQANIVFEADEKGEALVVSPDFSSGKWMGGHLPDQGWTSNLYQTYSLDATNVNPRRDPVGTLNVYVYDSEHGTKGVWISATGDTTIKPGGSWTLALLAGTGVAGTYKVQITESWPSSETQVANDSLKYEASVTLST